MDAIIGPMLETHAGFFHAHDDSEPGSIATDDSGHEYVKHAPGVYADGAVWEYTGGAPESSDPSPDAVDQSKESDSKAAEPETGETNE